MRSRRKHKINEGFLVSGSRMGTYGPPDIDQYKKDKETKK